MRSIYLDYAATAPLRPEVLDAMAPHLGGIAGNPSSVHRWGREARAALDGARQRTADLLGVSSGEVYFTRGGTESINLAILGSALPDPGTESHASATSAGSMQLFRSAVEHSAVREPMEELERRGFAVEVIGVSREGRLDLGELEAAISKARPVAANDGPPVGLASFQWVNQETGILLPIEEIADLCTAVGVRLHVDAVQGVGKLPLDLTSTPISLLSVSGHKLGGPRGTGVLVLRKGVTLRPLLFGGGQERGIRPGTEDTAGAVGMARALELAVENRVDESNRLAALRTRLEEGLRAGIPDLRVHGDTVPRAPHILGIGVPGIARDLLPAALDLEGVGVSEGSACRSGSSEVSPVLKALYGEGANTFAPLRLSLGWDTARAEIEEAIPRIVTTVERIRAAGVGIGR